MSSVISSTDVEDLVTSSADPLPESEPLRCEACDDALPPDALPNKYLPCCLGVMCGLCESEYRQICPGSTCDGRHALVGWGDDPPFVVALRDRYTQEVAKSQAWYTAAVTKTWLLPVPLAVYQAADTKAIKLADAALAAIAKLSAFQLYIQEFTPYTFAAPGYFVMGASRTHYVQRHEVLALLIQAAERCETPGNGSITSVLANPSVPCADVFIDNLSHLEAFRKLVAFFQTNPNAATLVRPTMAPQLFEEYTRNPMCTLADVITNRNVFKSDNVTSYTTFSLTLSDVMATRDKISWNLDYVVKFGIATLAEITRHPNIHMFNTKLFHADGPAYVATEWPRTAAITADMIAQVSKRNRREHWSAWIGNAKVSVATIMAFSDELPTDEYSYVVGRFKQADIVTYHANLLRWPKGCLVRYSAPVECVYPDSLTTHLGVHNYAWTIEAELLSGQRAGVAYITTKDVRIPLTYIRATWAIHQWSLSGLLDRADVLISNDTRVLSTTDTFWDLNASLTLDDAVDRPDDLPWDYRKVIKHPFGVV